MEVNFSLDPIDNLNYELDHIENEDFKLENVIVKAGGGGKVQIYRGPDRPTDENILIWIDTYVPPIVHTAMLTADDKYFITSDGFDFVVREEGEQSELYTSDNLQFITSDNNVFILNEELTNQLLTSDNKELITNDDKSFMTA